MMTLEKGVRWAIRADIPQILAIDGQTGERPWGENELLALLRRPNTIGLVARTQDVTKRDVILGFMVYELGEDKYYIHQIAVRADMRRLGVGRLFLDYIKAKLRNGGKRTSIETDARDSNLAAHLFLRSQGFKAVQVFRDFYADELVPGDDAVTEDGYRFQYILEN
jgi:ribosomal protein S18 acetylase RimI-like enzyme